MPSPFFTLPPTPFRPVDVYGNPKPAGGVGGAPNVVGTKWYIRKGGSDSNGGSSASLTPERSGSDGQTTANAIFISASAAFTSADIGKGICIPNSGTKYYRIVSITNSTTVVVDRTFTTLTSGITWAIGGAWLTNAPWQNNAAPAPNGDTVYIGAGTYRELIAVGISPTSEFKIIGDVFGTYTGDAGPVTLTAFTTNDKTAPGGALLNLQGKSNLTFERLQLVGGTGTTINGNAGSTNVTFRDCSVVLASAATMIGLVVGYDQPANWLFERCRMVFMGSATSPISITLTTGLGSDYDANVQFNNCSWPSSTGSTNFILVTNSGTAVGKGGGVKINNCFYIGRAPFLTTTAAQVSVLIPCTVYNSVISSATGAFTAGTLGQIVEDYNMVYGPTSHNNTNQGLHSPSVQYAPMFAFGQEMMWGEVPRPYGEPLAGSPWLNFNAKDTSTGPLDLRKGPRPSSAADWAVGPIQRGNNFIQTTTVTQAGGSAINVIGDGFHDFDVAVDAGPVTLSIYIRYDGGYVGPLPRLAIVGAQQVGVGDTEVPANVTSLNNFVQYSITINPTAAGVVTVRVVSGDTSGVGNVYADTFAAA